MTPSDLRARLTLPVVVAPMLLVSGPELVIASCRAGLVGSFPAANARTFEDREAWLVQIEQALSQARAEQGAAAVGPYAVNLIVRGAGTEAFEADLALMRRFTVPIVITSVGDPGLVAGIVHDYGGLVFHDVASVRHAEKAIAAGVDGLIVLTAGAGGHTGMANPFAIVPQIRRMWDGAILLAGAISDGRSIRAAEMLGADFAYMGTRFAATQESLAAPDYKALLVSQKTADVMITDRISGLNATFMRGSIAARGLDPDNLPPREALFKPQLPHGLKAWRDIWSAGHGVGLIDDIPTVAELTARLQAEYDASKAG
ncbi:MAG: 2-nitropropane dioxygenase [Brevundimonas sp.]|nr:2-nitropropane dioxygenase [Brevundimonas sp.]